MFAVTLLGQATTDWMTVGHFRVQVAAGRTFSVVPLLEGCYDKGNIGAVTRTAEALG